MLSSAPSTLRQASSRSTHDARPGCPSARRERTRDPAPSRRMPRPRLWGQRSRRRSGRCWARCLALESAVLRDGTSHRSREGHFRASARCQALGMYTSLRSRGPHSTDEKTCQMTSPLGRLGDRSLMLGKRIWSRGLFKPLKGFPTGVDCGCAGVPYWSHSLHPSTPIVRLRTSHLTWLSLSFSVSLTRDPCKDHMTVCVTPWPSA